MSARPEFSRYRLELLALFAVLVTFAGVAAQRDWLQALDRLLYDFVIQVAPLPLDDRMLIVGIDEQTLEAYGTWPWSRDLQAELLQRIAQQAPAALFVDIVYSRQTTIAADDALAAAVPEPVPLALPIIVDVLAYGQPPIEVLPYPQLLARADLLGHVHLELDSDSISRGTYLYQGVGAPVWRHVMLELARVLGGERFRLPRSLTACEGQPPAAGMTVERCGYVRIPFVGPPGTVPQLSALNLLQERISSDALKGKVVLLGLTTAGIADWVTSPVSGEGRPIAGVEYNANLLNALLQGRLIAVAPKPLSVALSLLIAALAALLIPRLAPKAMLGLTLLLLLIPVLCSALLLIWAGLLLPLSAGALAALLAYPFWSWRRHEIAWRYVDQEMLRLGSTELPSGALPSTTPAAHWRSHLQRLGRLLKLELQPVTQPKLRSELPKLNGSGAAAAAWRMLPQERLLEARLPDGELLRLAPAGETAAPAFNAQEQLLLRSTLAELAAEEQRPASLPGEGLALRIRLLQREAERVRQARDTGQKALEQMRNGVLVVSALGEVEFVNSAFFDLLGTQALDGELFAFLEEHVVLPLGRNWEEVWRQVTLRGEPFGFEARLPAERLAYFYCARLNAQESAPEMALDWAIIATDVTEVRAAQSLREEALAFVSHDLRSPIMSILALIRQRPDAPQAEAIERYAQRSLVVSEQFLQLSRLESQPVVETYELDLLDPLGNALDQLYAIAAEAGVVIDRSAVDRIDEPVWVHGNGELLERAFVNLLSNAVKYSAPSDGVVGGPVQVLLKLTTQTVAVSIADQGRGIPAADLPQLFEPYFRSSEPTLARKRGAGLGLRFTKTVAERHGGQIAVASELGAGATFTLTLPRLPIEPDLQ